MYPNEGGAAVEIVPQSVPPSILSIARTLTSDTHNRYQEGFKLLRDVRVIAVSVASRFQHDCRGATSPNQP